MKLLKTFGSLTALSLVVLYNSVNAPRSYAAQLGLGDSLEKGTPLTTDTASSDVCAEEAPVISPEALQSPSPLSQLGPDLVANAAATDVSRPSQFLVAQGFEECGIGGVAPEGGLPAAAAGFPLAAALIPAGAAAAAALPLALSGGDDPATTPAAVPNVPEPAETATASLFACLGIAGVMARRKMNRPK